MLIRELILESALAEAAGQQAGIPSFDQPGYFTVGDSHSNGISNYGRGSVWRALGKDGTSAFDPMHPQQIAKIPQGSVVAISAGANDYRAGIPNDKIVAQVNRLISLAQSRGAAVVYLLPTSASRGTASEAEGREGLRAALSNSVAAPIVDLGRAGPDGLHLVMSEYAKLARGIVNSYPIHRAAPSPEKAPVVTKPSAATDSNQSDQTLAQNPKLDQEFV